MGAKYRYPNSSKVYELNKKVGCIYYFKCGHRVTDNVFEDLINTQTGIAEWQKTKQLKLF